MLKAASDYHELNAGAHRKPPKVLSAPALVWHLAFWTNFQELGPDGKPLRNPDRSPVKKTPEDIRNAVDHYIVALRAALMANKDVGKRRPEHENAGPVVADIAQRAAEVRLTPCIAGVHLLFGSAYEEGSFRSKEISSLGRRQKDIFESTNRTVTLQFVWKMLDVTIRFEVHTENFSISTFVELDRDRGKAEKKRDSFSSIPELNESIDTIVRYLNDSDARPEAQSGGEEQEVRINRYCFHEFWSMYQNEVLPKHGFADSADDQIFRQIFADFRGFVASEQAVRFDDRGLFEDGKPPAWGWEAKKKLLPLIQHRNRAEHSRYECAVNYMLDGRALYLSTLGPQLPSIPEDERIPVEFIVYAHTQFDKTTIVNKWQLGRLVSQILLLGTLRLCALKDVKFLYKAGEGLSSLEENTQAARVAIALTESGPIGGGQAANVQNRNAVKLIADAHKKLNKITGDFLDETGNGPLFRIERSRFYVQQFDENVKLLRIKRLEGDQPYDQFIRRRLGSEFDFINRLGVRYERASASVVTLDQNFLAITQNFLAITQNALVGETMGIQSRIHKIQEWGEFALLAALVPYYVVHLLVLMADEHAFFIPAMTFCTWIVFFTIALYRILQGSKSFANDRALIGMFFFVGLMISIVWYWQSYRNEAARGKPEAQRHRSEWLDPQKQILGSQRILERLASEGGRRE
jgi:hypothetical protein